MLRAYFGHHKCASTWIRAIIEAVARDVGLRSRVALDPKTPSGHGVLTDYRSDIPRKDLGEYVQSEGIDLVSCITADARQAAALPLFRGFHVVRDPRDIIVSGYFSHRNSHPTNGLPHLSAHRERLRSVSKEEGIRLEMDFSAQLLDDLAEWDYEQPDVLELKMETLTTRPYETFIRIFEFLELMSWEGDARMADRTRVFVRSALNRLSLRHSALSPLRSPIAVTGSILLGHVYNHRFEKKTDGRTTGEENANSHYRKGVAGDWINHFTEEHMDYFNDRFGDLLVRLGYETDVGRPTDRSVTDRSTVTQ